MENLNCLLSESIRVDGVCVCVYDVMVTSVKGVFSAFTLRELEINK